MENRRKVDGKTRGAKLKTKIEYQIRKHDLCIQTSPEADTVRDRERKVVVREFKRRQCSGGAHSKNRVEGEYVGEKGKICVAWEITFFYWTGSIKEGGCRK